MQDVVQHDRQLIAEIADGHVLAGKTAELRPAHRVEREQDFGLGSFLVDRGPRIADVAAGDVVSLALRDEDQDFHLVLLHLLALIILDLDLPQVQCGLVALDLIDFLVADAAPLGQLFARLGILDVHGLVIIGRELLPFRLGHFDQRFIVPLCGHDAEFQGAGGADDLADFVGLDLLLLGRAPAHAGHDDLHHVVAQAFYRDFLLPAGIDALADRGEQRIHFFRPPLGFRFIDLIDQDRSAAEVDAELRRPAAEDHHQAGQNAQT